jgi:N-acetylneuraminic acid mutarotase
MVWEDVASLTVPRDSLAVVAGADGRIYAIGGTDDNFIPYNTVEAYDPTNNSWTRVASLPSARVQLAATLGADGRIYALGGHDFHRAFNDVWAYDPDLNTWSSVAGMPTARAGLAAAMDSAGQLYAIGGYFPNQQLFNLVEVYDPQTDTWRSVSTMPTTRRNLAAVTGGDGCIYAMGGLAPSPDGVGRIVATVEAYNPQTDLWVSSDASPSGAYSLILSGASGPHSLQLSPYLGIRWRSRERPLR